MEINWQKFYANIPKLRLEFFYLSTIFAIVAFFADALIWRDFLYPLDVYNELDTKSITLINFISVIAGVIIPTGGAIDIVFKLKYLQQRSSIPSEKVFSTIIAVRIIFLITLYPTMAIFVYLLVESGTLPIDTSFVLALISFVIITSVLLALLIIISKVDLFNQKILALLFFPFKRFEKAQVIKIRLSTRASSFARTFYELRAVRPYLPRIIFFTMILWSTRFISMYLIFLVLIDLPFYIIVISSTVSSFTTMIPAFIPSMAGVRDIVTTEVLNKYSLNTEVYLLTSLMNNVQIIVFLIIAIFIAIVMRKYVKNKKFSEQSLEKDIH
jgi:uncharacterized protein (TIRG00374 family)